MENLDGINNQITGLSDEFKQKLDSLNHQLNESKVESEKGNIQKKIETVSGVYENALNRLKTKQEEVEKMEKIKSIEIEKKRTAQEQTIKNNALLEWKKSGGDVMKFEESWPTIRDALLNEKVVSALLSKKTNPPKPRFTSF